MVLCGVAAGQLNFPHVCPQLLDPTTLKTRHSQQGLGHWVRDMCVGPDGALYTASGRRITVWSTRDLQQLRVLDTTAGAIRALTVTRKYIITGTHNQNVRAERVDNAGALVTVGLLFLKDPRLYH